MSVLLEVCTERAEDSVAAVSAGAGRIELNTALALGGLTPSVGCLAATRAAVDVPIIAMLRPRPGPFAYSASDFDVLRRDADLLRMHGADGFAFGCLTPDGHIDTARCQTLMAQHPDAEWVFHRAFDVLPNLFEGLDILIDLGVRRVLTSGGAASAVEGAEALKALIEQADGRIEMLPGGGIRPHNVAALVQATGATQVHASCSAVRVDTSGQHQAWLNFRSAQPLSANQYKRTDAQQVAELIHALLR
ncbi:MAG: copper homeostasis protein CutC [Rhodothermales bacterium]